MENKKDTTNNAYIQIVDKSKKKLKYTNQAFRNKSAQMAENNSSLSC